MSSEHDGPSGKPDPHIVTINIAHRIMLKVEQVVRRDTDAKKFELLHEVFTLEGTPRVGWSRTVFNYGPLDHGGRVSKSFIWDIPIMLELRDGWERYVEEKTLKCMREALNG